jgi:hypothetical protein
MPEAIVTVGEILVEIMATTPGDGFREPIELVGPYPSGAPAIFIDQVARLGHPCAIVACVGDDDFGRLNVDRLRRDGVDVSAIAVDPQAVTGSAFVSYRADGSRDFVFNIVHSANGRLTWTDRIQSIVAGAAHLHVTGSSLGTPAIADAIMRAVQLIKQNGGTMSFDPNVRSEMLHAPGLRTQLRRILDATDLFLPSDAELLLFSDTTDENAAIADLLSRGVRAIVHKQGASGARYIDRTDDIAIRGFPVGEVDPTGAGDIFGATFVTGWLAKLPPAKNLRRATAAGAIAVTRRGPMEGVSTSPELDRFLAR